MDRTMKFLLGIVAASLVMLNLQLAGVEFVKEAHAELMSSDVQGIESKLEDIAKAIRSLD
ncbi:MAG: hypothetical protein CMN75_04655 [Spirochaeta sp.]|nr:hypothetical protein [Spirochaeta sp.]RPG11860.1 MAG: hypothetical protein CBC32_004655 [Proteobacteria bacterium TMED72]